MTQEIKDKIMCAGWDVEYWENYKYQLDHGMINSVSDDSSQKEMIYCKNKLEESKEKQNNLKMKYAEFLV